MHLFSINRKSQYIKPVLSVLVFIGIVALMWGGLSETEQRGGVEQARLLKDALRRASASCYANEGRYPPTLDYILQNYGVVVNEDKFVVTYSAFAQNIMPTINVVERGKESNNGDDD